MTLKTTDLQYSFPPELVATEARPRGESRILHIPRDNEKFAELTWQKFLALFQPGDVLVLNDSKVLWARLVVKKPSGSEGEIFFLKNEGRRWEILSKAMNLKEGGEIELPGGVKAKVVKADRVSRIELLQDLDLPKYFEQWGHVPLPPYIISARESHSDAATDKERYQNVWAKQWGSVAAPTAGLHFAQEHLDQLKKKGVNLATITLHVGAGTFLPIQSENLDEFQIHSEVVRVSRETCEVILKAQAAGKKIWACGTTVLRALETAVHASPTAGTRLPLIAPFLGETTLFVKPGYRFLVVDGLLTNFHQPESTLMALAAAFATRQTATGKNDAKKAVEKLINAYNWAIEKKFRLFSYGDLTVIS